MSPPKLEHSTDAIVFPVGSEVYHRTEPSKMGIVIQIRMLPGCYVYVVQWAISQSGDHYGFELTSERGFENS